MQESFESRELEIMQKDPFGATHDLMKYWLYGFFSTLPHRYNLPSNPILAKCERVGDQISDDIRAINKLVAVKKDVQSKKFRQTAKSLHSNTTNFIGLVSAFKESIACPEGMKRDLDSILPAMKMLLPLSEVLITGKIVMHKKWLRIRPLVSELENYLWNVKDPSEKFNVKISLRGDPLVFADRAQLMRAMFNLLHDAVTHSKGEDIIVNIGATKKSLVFATTNRGRTLAKEVIDLIGEQPYTTDDNRELLHGYGKRVAKDVALAHGGQLYKENTGRGFRLGFAIPRQRRMKAA